MARDEDRNLAQVLKDFLPFDNPGAVLLLAAAVLAMIAANSPLSGLYDGLMATTVGVQVGELIISKPLLLWINDGLMAVFFFLVGLEIKREFLEGELTEPSQVVLPALGAVGGMLVPAAIYWSLNHGDAQAMDGWAIPVATDIAFALGLLKVLGDRVPRTLKVFLLTLAIFDDLAAIIIIAIFYSGDLSLSALIAAMVFLGLGAVLNRLRVTRTSAYVLIGICLWVALLKSGVHATLAGVLLALCVPMRAPDGSSPLGELEHDLHPPVSLWILPVFAFANAGLSLSGMGLDDLSHPVTLGVIAGLVLGKPIGIMGMLALGVALGLTRRPQGVSWTHLLGVSCICGIGFTMSLFIAGLAFEHGSTAHFVGDRLGILVGSLLSAIAGYVLLRFSLPERARAPADDPLV